MKKFRVGQKSSKRVPSHLSELKFAKMSEVLTRLVKQKERDILVVGTLRGLRRSRRKIPRHERKAATRSANQERADTHAIHPHMGDRQGGERCMMVPHSS